MFNRFYRHRGKRILDLLIAGPLLLLLLPIIGVITILIRLDSPGPAFFVQDRLGIGGEIFSMYKFRTMTHRLRTTHEEILGEHPEVTRVGKWLRRFKIDELPQFLNVIKGDMSIVGPRPALPEQLAEYDDIGRQRLQVRMGITGLAQTNGSIYLSWPERWRYDALYVERLSLKLDLQIMVRTVAVIFLGENKFLKKPQAGKRNRSLEDWRH